MRSSDTELDDVTYAEISRRSSAGDALAEKGQHESAVAEYNEAWKLIPEPKNNWEASTWVLAAIADSCFFLGKWKSARQALEYAMTCPNAIGNPFLHLRFGQVLFELDEADAAANELIRAYMGAGEKIFARDHPKYFAFLRSKAVI